MGVDFAHLHVHTEYSLLDGHSRTKNLVAQAKALGMQHLAITDHGAMYGIPEFYDACKAEGIHPILGEESYLCEDVNSKGETHHMLLLARNNVGYRNLMQITTFAQRNHYRRPRVDKKFLAEHAEGLIVTSSCLSGEIPKLLLKGDDDRARQQAKWYQDTFGPENFFIEIQEHYGKDSPQGDLNRRLFDLHKELQIPMVLTNDLHYVKKKDAVPQDIMLCVQTNSKYDEPKRMKFDSEEYYLKSPEEMARLFPDLSEALMNTVRVAEMCEVDPLDPMFRGKLPNFPIPSEYRSQDEYLYQLCLLGVKERFGEMSEGIQKQLDYEFSIIAQKGFVEYFLVVWDFVNFCNQHNIRCSARGSAAGSLVAYVLGITNVDPLRYQLLFERFLNPERSDMPDIDMDFPDAQREDVINYVSEKYGPDKVAQIVTFNTMAAKAAVKDVARSMGWQGLGDQISRLIPTGPKVTLPKSLNEVPELKQLYEHNQQAKKLLDHALDLEGSIRNTGVHAAGVLIANESLDNLVPLHLRDPKNPEAGRIIAYEQKYLEDRGLIKFDFLGLANLTTLQNTVKFIKESRGEDINLDKIPLDNKKAFELLALGETTGIFQLESAKMREYIKMLGPTCIEDITAMVALYRPGPMDSIPDFVDSKHGRKKVKYLDKRLEQWLAESYGVIVYQDQVLLIAVHLAGFSWGKVNKFRKALSKKIMHEIEGYKGDFIEGCIKNDVKEDVAKTLFDLILPFGGYGFNKAHAASYAVVAYHTAYLKANYTAEFMAATLTTEAADAKKVANAVAECKRMKVEVLCPDVNKSDTGFSVENGNVRFGLLAIKGIGDGPASEIVRERRANGEFKSIADFCTRVDSRMVGKGAIETLIKAGAFDSLGKRHQHLDAVERAVAFGKREREAQTRGLISLFGEIEETDSAFEFALNASAVEIARSQLLAWEKELIGVYVSHNPLEQLQHLMGDKGVTHNTGMITEEHSKQKVFLGGTIIETRRLTTKKGDTMCVAKIEDMYGSIGVTVFPRAYEQTSELWEEGQRVMVRGEVQFRNDEPTILCDKAEAFEASVEEMDRRPHHVWLTIQLTGEDQRAIEDDMIKVQDVYNCLHNKPGRDHYELLVMNGEWQVLLTPHDNNIHYTPDLYNQLISVIGKDCIEVKVLD